MRLKAEQLRAIKEVIATSDPQAEVVLFGSRTDDAQRGGDIDLLIMSSKIDLDERRRIKLKLLNRLGDQKIDVVVATDDSRPFVRIARKEGVKL